MNEEKNGELNNDVFDSKKILGELFAELEKQDEETTVKEDEEEASSFKNFQKEIEEESKKAQENMSDEELDRLLKEVSQKAESKREEKKIKPYVKEFPPDYVNAYLSSVPEDATPFLVADALLRSLSELGKVNIEYISALSKKSAKEVIDELTFKDGIYQNPSTWGEKFSEGWETANEYLSGNLFIKRKQAKEAVEKYGDIFLRNVKALDAVYKKTVSSDEIYATLGSPWIPESVYNDFFFQTFKPRYKRKDGIYYDEVVKSWKITYLLTTGYDVQGMSATEILERTLNNRPIEIFKKRINKTDRRVLDKTATMQAIEVQKTLIDKFRVWLFDDEERKAKLERIYYELYGSITARKFNGSFLLLPDKNPEITLYKHQLDAIARIILTPSTLLAHAVGTGKTYIMIAAGLEMKRTGTSPKNMYVVPNAILGQWEEDFKTLYPKCNILVVKKTMMTPSKMPSTLKRIKDEDIDAIVIPYSSFQKIIPGIKAQIAELKAKINRLGNDPKYKSIKLDCFKKITELEKARQDAGGALTFEDLGITSLFVDEAHNFKNVTVSVNANQSGLTRGGAKIADDMFTKVKIMRKNKNTKSIVFATGTPVTNSITELYVMQSFLQPEDLKFLKLDSFDNWALTFGEKSMNFEIDVDSSHYRIVERFNRFHNLPELTNLFAGVADFHLEDLDEIFNRKVDYKTIVVPRSDEQVAYVKTLADRTEAVRYHSFDREQDNLLKITVDGRKCALDVRLVDPTASPKICKVDYLAENVYTIYKDNPQVTQLIFCDTSTPKSGFNVYDELRNKLLLKGIPSCEIEFVQNAKTSAQKQAVYDLMNSGDIRILVGSTQTLGTGVNVQKKLYAVHHLDVPWKPSEMVQREGRMLRQGNQNDNVEVYRYVTAGSFDSYSWQLLESKQKFICQLLSGSFDERDGDELNELVLTYAEIKALAIGDPKIKERVETANELDRLKLVKASRIARREYLGAKLEDLPKVITSKKEYLKALKEDFRTVSNYPKGNYKELGEMILNALKTPPKAGEMEFIATYRGIDIYLPSSALEAVPRVILMGSNQKLIDLKNSEGELLSAVGIMQRVDDYYDKMIEYIKNNQKALIEREKELEQVKNELLADTGDIDADIERLKNHLDSLDLILGIQNDKK